MEVYLDNAATTKVLPSIARAMTYVLTENYGNPSGVYAKSRAAQELLLTAREQVAALLHCSEKELIFTGGGSEGDTAILRGIAGKYRDKGRHIVTTQIEHHAILNTCAALEKEGFDLTYLPVDERGLVRLADAEKALTDKTILLSVMYANNEIGTIQPIRELGALARSRGVLFHTDAVQAAGHIPIDVEADNIDLLTLTAHKFHGPKGCGAIYIRNGIKIAPLIYGGPQERGWRAGTENTPGICGLGLAAVHARTHMTANNQRIKRLRDLLLNEILTRMPEVVLNGDPVHRLPNNLNLFFPGIAGEDLLLLLDAAGIAASSGSACASGSLDPSHVLLAIGKTAEEAKASLRLTLSEFTVEEDIRYTVAVLQEAVRRLRGR